MTNTFKIGDTISHKEANVQYTIWNEDDFWYCLKSVDFDSAIRIPKKGAALKMWRKVGN